MAAAQQPSASDVGAKGAADDLQCEARAAVAAQRVLPGSRLLDMTPCSDHQACARGEALPRRADRAHPPPQDGATVRGHKDGTATKQMGSVLRSTPPPQNSKASPAARRDAGNLGCDRSHHCFLHWGRWRVGRRVSCRTHNRWPGGGALTPATAVGGPAGGANFRPSNHANLSKSAQMPASSARPNWVFLGPATERGAPSKWCTSPGLVRRGPSNGQERPWAWGCAA